MTAITAPLFHWVVQHAFGGLIQISFPISMEMVLSLSQDILMIYLDSAICIWISLYVAGILWPFLIETTYCTRILLAVLRCVLFPPWPWLFDDVFLRSHLHLFAALKEQYTFYLSSIPFSTSKRNAVLLSISNSFTRPILRIPCLGYMQSHLQYLLSIPSKQPSGLIHSRPSRDTSAASSVSHPMLVISSCALQKCFPAHGHLEKG